MRRATLCCGLSVLLTACGSYCETILSRAESPGHRYDAQAYTIECGVMVPFNAYARIKKAESSNWTDVVTSHEVDFVPHLRWLGASNLQVTIDCDTDVTCGIDTTRHWAVSGRRQWEDVQITYAIGDRLRQHVSAENLAKLPQ